MKFLIKINIFLLITFLFNSCRSPTNYIYCDGNQKIKIKDFVFSNDSLVDFPPIFTTKNFDNVTDTFAIVNFNCGIVKNSNIYLNETLKKKDYLEWFNFVLSYCQLQMKHMHNLRKCCFHSITEIDSLINDYNDHWIKKLFRMQDEFICNNNFNLDSMHSVVLKELKDTKNQNQTIKFIFVH